MPRRRDIPKTERAKTDESLRAEREQTDRALAKQKLDAEHAAVEVIQQARDTADAVLATARDEADVRLETTTAPTGTVDAIEVERQHEDHAIDAERAAADRGVRLEREANARALAALLPMERDNTDRYLLTERARADASLANRDDFLGIVSHDLRNLLGGIVMGAGLMAKAAPKNDDGRKILAGTDRIQRYAARMNRLIADLIDIAAIDAGKLALTRAPGDLCAVVQEALDTFIPAAHAKHISLTHEAGEEPLLGNFDHDRMLQVLGNVLANAVKFTSDGGTVNVRAEQDDGELRVIVSDTGCGIPPEMLDLVFERFWQVGENDRRGSGLGLYISKSIVEAHGGRMWAESSPGQGSTFTIALPARTA